MWDTPTECHEKIIWMRVPLFSDLTIQLRHLIYIYVGGQHGLRESKRRSIRWRAGHPSISWRFVTNSTAWAPLGACWNNKITTLYMTEPVAGTIHFAEHAPSSTESSSRKPRNQYLAKISLKSCSYQSVSMTEKKALLERNESWVGQISWKTNIESGILAQRCQNWSNLSFCCETLSNIGSNGTSQWQKSLVSRWPWQVSRSVLARDNRAT